MWTLPGGDSQISGYAVSKADELSEDTPLQLLEAEEEMRLGMGLWERSNGWNLIVHLPTAHQEEYYPAS